MRTLHSKGVVPGEDFFRFASGKDTELDKILAKYDVYGSIAHAFMLKKMVVISDKDFALLKEGLLEILTLSEEGKFEIKPEDEDCHTVIENYLTEKYGDVGKKIHTFRSRNDQVLVATRLLSKDYLINFALLSVILGETLYNISKKHEDVPMVGITHTREAMPSSVGLFFDSYLSALLRNLRRINDAFELNDICPLGSGTGYGSPAQLDRQLTSNLLGFREVQDNSLDCQNSRGELEEDILNTLYRNQRNIARLANELIWYSKSEFGYFTIPDEFTTGSSAMPQKKNPDGLELIRAKEAVIHGKLITLQDLCSKLPSGYNRDLQLTKGPLMEGFEEAYNSTRIMTKILAGLEVNRERLIEACRKHPEIYATHEALDIVTEKGTPFRTAYQMVKNGEVKLRERDPIEELKRSTHIGGTGSLTLESHKEQLDVYKRIFESYRARFDQTVADLLALK